MTMAGLKAGCQTYTWEMLGEAWKGSPDDLLSAIAGAGYAGIEITDAMIGHYAEDTAGFDAALRQHGLTLVALAVASPSGYTLEDAVGSDVAMIERWIGYAGHFPGCVVSLGSATAVSDGPREAKFQIAAEVYNRAGAAGKAAGVGIAVHPSSHHNTLLFDRADYDRLFALVDGDLVGWVPDTGHLLRGHADIHDTMTTYSDRIRYLHLKDADAHGQWAMLGEGVCDIARVIEIAAGAPGFNGWVIAEEESDRAAANPTEAVRINRDTLSRYGL
jgi:sugar phosphate isomerase/epimerase